MTDYGAGEVNVWDRIEGHSVDVPDHPYNRSSEITIEEARRKALNDDLDPEDCPLVVSSNMSADPCEGVQGSYTAIIELDDHFPSTPGTCQECPSEFGISREANTMAGVGMLNCLLCDHIVADWR